MPAVPRTARSVAALSVAALAVLGAPPGAASATAGDTAGPTLRFGPEVAFAVGTEVADFDMAGTTRRSDDYTVVPHQLVWSATDPSGVCGYHLDRVYAGSAPDRLLTNTQQTSYQDVLNDYSDDFGGGSLDAVGWRVTALDCAGNRSLAYAGSGPLVVQEDGRSHETGGAGRVSYTGTWSRSTCHCASRGRQAWTTTPGASITLRRTYAAGDHVGIVMARGPQRGAAHVYLDGRRIATLDTNAPVNGNRRIVLDREVTAGTHTVRVVNAGTPAAPRIDVDAFLAS